MTNTPPLWSSDVPISVPEPPKDPVLVPMGGLGITQYGMVHDLTPTEFDFYRRPSYAPELPTTDIVYDDTAVG